VDEATRKSAAKDWHDHALAITDLVCTPTGRILSVSMDRTLKIWHLSGACLSTIVFPCGLTSVVTDDVERRVFVGGVDGRVYAVDLIDGTHVVAEALHAHDANLRLLSHHSYDSINCIEFRKSVTTLSMSINQSKLFSGSDDGLVCAWDIQSGQMLQSFDMKGVFYSIRKH
jgi:WD40 repeat protein